MDLIHLKPNTSQRGISLISVMMAVAISTTVMMGLMGAIVSVQKEARKISEKSEMQEVAQEVKFMWGKTSECESSLKHKLLKFGGAFAPSMTSKRQRFILPRVGTQNKKTYNRNRAVTLDKVDIQLIDGDVSAKKFLGKVSLIPYDSEGEMIDYMKPKSVYLDIETNDSGNIRTCRALGDSDSFTVGGGLNFDSFYIKKFNDIDEGSDVCCNPGDILISGHWASYVGEKNSHMKRNSDDRCVRPYEGEGIEQDGDFEIFCGKVPD